MNLFRKNRVPIVAYIVISAVLAMGISFWIGIHQSVWFDEAYSILVAKQGVGHIIHLVSLDTHPPGYYILLHAWGSLFGWGAVSLRLLSELAMGGALVVAGLLVRRLFGDRAAIFSVILAAIAPLLLRYGFEIRMYALASLIGVAATYVLVAARADAGRYAWRWILYGVLVAVGMLTLYQLALLWLAHVAWLAYVDRKHLKQVWLLPWARAYVGAFILFVPWLPKFIGQIGNGSLANIGQPMNIEQLLGAVSFNILYEPLWQVGVAGTLVLIAAIVGAVWAWRYTYRQRKLREHLLLLTLYIAVPIVLFMVISLVRPMYVERYLSQVAIGLIMLFGVITAAVTKKMPKAHRMVVYVLAAGSMLAGVYQLAVVGNYNFQRMQKPAVAQVAHTIDCNGATVVAADPYVETELSYYLPTSCSTHFYSQWATLGGGYAPYSNSPLRLASKNILPMGKRLYYVYYGEPQLNVAATYTKTATYTKGGLTVVTYETHS